MEMLSRLLSFAGRRAEPAAAPDAAFVAHVARGDRARDAGDWEEARAAYEAARAERPGAPDLDLRLALVQEEAGDLAGAEAICRRVVAERPGEADAQLRLGRLLTRRGRGGRSFPLVSQSGESGGVRDPSGAGGRSARRGLDGRRRRREALDFADAGAFAQARAVLDPLVAQGRADLAGVLGNVCKELGDFAAARSAYAHEAQAADDAAQLESHLQMGHFEKVMRNYPAALARFAPRARFSRTTRPAHGRRAGARNRTLPRPDDARD
jgi:thioredoxin-like negative regulator of GroEL